MGMMRIVGGIPVLCAIANNANAAGTVGTLGCFVVDLEARRLASRDPTLLPGVAIPTRLVDGCTHGLCLAHVTFQIALPSREPAEGQVAPSKIARQKIRRITWH